jgi:hypothetical protein
VLNILKKVTVLLTIFGMVNISLAGSVFGVDFYDEADFSKSQYQFTPEAMAKLPTIANQRFNFLRTITDFNEGDPSQKICSCYQINNNNINPRQCDFEKGLVSNPDLKTVLTIENPQKWLSSVDSAIAYIYQFVLPLVGNIPYPSDPQLQPDFWGTKPDTMKAAGCVLSTAPKNQLVAIVVGLEVGTHLNPTASNFDHKITQVNNLNTYVTNLITALKRFGIKKSIYVTTSLAPSNCDLNDSKCHKVYEELQLVNGEYKLNNQQQQADVDGVIKTIDFPQVTQALKQIKNQDYDGIAPGVLISLYNYWRYTPNIHYDQLNTQQWVDQIGEFYNKIHAAFDNNKDLKNLPVSVAEAGWPAAGDNKYDNSPNQPNNLTQTHLLQGLHQWGVQNSPAPYIFIWRLFDVDAEVANLYPGGDNNPEGHYGFYPGSLNKYINVDKPQPRNAKMLPNFK